MQINHDEARKPGGYTRLLLWSAFSLLIVAAAYGDLCLEEIWSLGFALDSASLQEVFCRFKHNNNHLLNTLYLYLVRDTDNFLVFRTMSVISGIVSLWLLTFIAGRERGKTEANLVLILAGSSFPLLLYFSEARGFAPAILMALVAYIAMQKHDEFLSKTSLAIFWIASAAGMLAHSSFVIISLGLLIFSLARKKSESAKPWFYQLLIHLPIIAFFAGWYRFYLAEMETGGGQIFSAGRLLGQIGAYLLGMPDSSASLLLAAIIFIVLLLAGLRRLYRNSENWLVFAGILFIAPLLILTIWQPQFLHFRYFVICFPFFYLLLADLIAETWRHRPQLRLLLILLLIAMLFGQWQRNFTLLKYGRGNYRSAISYILANSQKIPVLVGSDHDFRNPTLIEYYTQRGKAGGALKYVTARDWRETPPEFFIGHSLTPTFDPATTQILAGIGEYELLAGWPAAPVSGFHWYLYRRKLQ